jgi:predicted lipid carrier protein YhbT
VAGEWLTVPTEAGLRTTREHAKGDAAIRGSASDLLLALWRRVPADQLEIIGNRTVAEQLLAYPRLG